MTIDPTKITPEKLAEMNDSLIVDNNHLRQRVCDLEQDAMRYRFLRDNPEFQIEYTGELALDQHMDEAMSH